MTVKVANSRFITSSLRGGFYQQLLLSISDFKTLGNRLVSMAGLAQGFRQIDALEEISRVLSNFPLSEYHYAGQYYWGWCNLRKGKDPEQYLETVINHSSSFRAMALIDVATFQARESYETAIKYYEEAAHWASSPSTAVQAARSIAAVKGLEGFHDHALIELERIFPLVRYAKPHIYYQYLNSYAVELGEVGRLEEAANVCRVILASPYIKAYPEWRETGKEIYLRGYKSRSSIPVIQSFLVPEKQPEKIQNVLRLPERNTAPVRLRTKPAKVLSYVDWKERMVKEEKDEIPPDADEGDLYLRLMEMIALKDLNAWELRQVIDFVEKLRPNAEQN